MSDQKHRWSRCSIISGEKPGVLPATLKARKQRLLEETVMLKNVSLVRVLTLTFVTSMLLGAMGCNTVEGVGKDTQKAGEKLENAADRNK